MGADRIGLGVDGPAVAVSAASADRPARLMIRSTSARPAALANGTAAAAWAVILASPYRGSGMRSRPAAELPLLTRGQMIALSGRLTCQRLS